MRIGIDLGGTKIAAGLVDDNYAIVCKAERRTEASRPAGEIVKDIVAVARELYDQAGGSVQSIGMGVPGTIDNQKGTIAYTTNLPFQNEPVVAVLSAACNVPVFLGNDANAAALGEVYAGAGGGCRSLLMVTLGTGIGGGVIIGGKIHEGFNGVAGEIGHMSIVYDGRICGCGRPGCFEAYASASALVAQTQEAMQEHPDSLMWRASGKIDARTPFIYAREGDAAAQAVVDRYIDYLASGVANLINILQPEVVCIGGGVSGEGENLLAPLRERVNAIEYMRMDPRSRIVRATLGNDAGIIGAALLSLSYS